MLFGISDQPGVAQHVCDHLLHVVKSANKKADVYKVNNKNKYTAHSIKLHYESKLSADTFIIKISCHGHEN